MIESSENGSDKSLEVRDKVYRVIREVLDVEEVTSSASLVWDFLADSLQLVELYTTLENEFNIQITADDVEGEKNCLRRLHTC